MAVNEFGGLATMFSRLLTLRDQGESWGTSSLMSIGAKCRLIIVEGHMYPEMYVGDKKKFDIMQQAIIQFFGDKGIDRIYYHENNGEYWINLDYTSDHPGGRYMNDNVKLLINIP